MNRRAKITIAVLTLVSLLSTGTMFVAMWQAWIAQVEQRRLEGRWTGAHWMQGIEENVASVERCCEKMPSADPAQAAQSCQTATCGTTEADHNARFVEEANRLLVPGLKDCETEGEYWDGPLARELERWRSDNPRAPLPAPLIERARKQWQERCAAFNARVAERIAREGR